jgi:hypothetical protein
MSQQFSRLFLTTPPDSSACAPGFGEAARARRRGGALLVAVIALTAIGRPAAQDSRFILGDAQPGVALEDGRLLIAFPLVNRSPSAVLDIRIARIALGGEEPVRPDRLPLTLGDLAPGDHVVLQLAFTETESSLRRQYRLTIHGTHRMAGRERPFVVTRQIARPLPDDGQRATRRARVAPRFVDGATAPPSAFSERIGEEPDVPPLPEGRDSGETQSPNNPRVEISETPDPDLPPIGVGRARRDVQFVRISNEPLTSADTKGGFPWDPSGASVDHDKHGQVVFLTGNLYTLLSTDGGVTFNHLDPTTIFPPLSFPLDGMPQQDLGLCCDMNMIYIPRIDRFVWVLHTKGSKIGETTNSDGDVVPINAYNRLRVATASTQQVVASGGTAWTYWDMTTYLLGLPKKAFLDYPDVSFTDDFLHISVVQTHATDNWGFLVIRVPLTQVQSGGVITLGHTNPSDGGTALGARLAHDSRDAAYWFGHDTNGKVRIFEWRDSSNTYSWHSRSVTAWKDSDYASIVPDGVTDWLAKNSAAIRGGTVGDVFVGFDHHRIITIAWNAGRGGSFLQPYVRLQRFLRVMSGGSTQWHTGQSFQIWNPDIAFNHAHLATNGNGEVGVAVGVGGATSHATPVAGFLGDSVLYVSGVSSASLDIYGDYAAIRPHWPNTKLFSVSDYFLKAKASGGFTVHHQYRLFGRSGDGSD